MRGAKDKETKINIQKTKIEKNTMKNFKSNLDFLKAKFLCFYNNRV